MKTLSAVDWVAVILVLVGGLNWGLVGIAELDIVSALFGEGSMLARIVFGLVGVATVYLAVLAPKLRKA